MPCSAAIFRAAGPACAAPSPFWGSGAGVLPAGAGAGGAFAADFGADAAGPSPSSMRPMTVPTSTSVPSSTSTSASVPAVGAGISRLTLSVSSSTSGSSAATWSPAFLSQRAIVASVTNSPSVGMRISTLISHSLRIVGGSKREGLLDQPALLALVLGKGPGGR